MSVRYTREAALAVLNSMNLRDAIEVVRTFAAVEFVESYGLCDVLDGLERVEEDLFPAEPEPRFVSSDFSYIEYPRSGGIRL